MSIPVFIIGYCPLTFDGYRPLTFNGYRPLTFVRRQVDCAIPICVFDAWHNLSAAGRLHHSDMCFQHISATSIVSPPHIQWVSPPHIRSAASRLCHSDMRLRRMAQSLGGRSVAPFRYVLSAHRCNL